MLIFLPCCVGRAHVPLAMSSRGTEELSAAAHCPGAGRWSRMEEQLLWHRAGWLSPGSSVHGTRSCLVRGKASVLSAAQKGSCWRGLNLKVDLVWGGIGADNPQQVLSMEVTLIDSVLGYKKCGKKIPWVRIRTNSIMPWYWNCLSLLCFVMDFQCVVRCHEK